MTHKKILFTAAFAALSVCTLGAGVQARALDGDRTGMSEQQKQLVEERKTALKERLTATREARVNNLEDRRLAMCEKRQEKINNILANGTERNKKHLAVFQKIEEKIKEFYVDKNLSTEGYDAAVANADDKEAAALAAIEASAETTFDCESADGGKPGAAIRELMKTRHSALKEYRTAVKDLNKVVKQAHGKQQNNDTSTETDTEGGEQ